MSIRNPFSCYLQHPWVIHFTETSDMKVRDGRGPGFDPPYTDFTPLELYQFTAGADLAFWFKELLLTLTTIMAHTIDFWRCCTPETSISFNGNWRNSAAQHIQGLILNWLCWDPCLTHWFKVTLYSPTQYLLYTLLSAALHFSGYALWAREYRACLHCSQGVL